MADDRDPFANGPDPADPDNPLNQFFAQFGITPAQTASSTSTSSSAASRARCSSSPPRWPGWAPPTPTAG